MNELLQEFLLQPLLGYFINLASGERSAAFAESRAAKIREVQENEESLKRAIASSGSIRDEIRLACTQLAADRQTVGEEVNGPLWHMFSEEQFQSDLADWLMVGGIEEGRAAKERLICSIQSTLKNASATKATIDFAGTELFERLEKMMFSNALLARWRHSLSLEYLREQVAALKTRAEEAAGLYSPERQRQALDCYCEKALAAWDIIDLSNLPEGDIHMATQKLLLRQLYMPLHIEVEREPADSASGEELAKIEARREALRRWAAGHSHVRSGEEAREPKGLSIGAIMEDALRLVVLGDPGGGKTTMLRWMATAYLLRHNNDPAFADLPDTATLRNEPWIPVLIRCRDLGEADLCRSFTDFLTQHLHKTELLPEEAEVMCAVILDLIAKGRVLLLVDGLDEISNPQVRVQFCQELERAAARYPNAPILVTSRIVGYRDMPYRMGAGFRHGLIADLNREDKDLFAARWVEVTEHQQTSTERKRRAEELLSALHASDRIERLTGNPMLLTTLALVKRKVGKLPNKRSKLYQEAVSVLLNWNPSRYQTIDEDEALPQLEFLAYEMCGRGVQRLVEDDVLELLDRLRTEYPNVRAVKRRTPEEFLALLEARSSILIKAGGVWQKAEEKPVWEFRHLTFQEYLAARAILDGKYPGRVRTLSLAEQVAPLAGSVHQSERWLKYKQGEEWEHNESWREALRLLVVECPDDDVDDVLLAILKPLDNEDGRTVRPRAILAGLCLADEPNIDDTTAESLLTAFAGQVTFSDGELELTSIDQAAVQIAGGIWADTLKDSLVRSFASGSDESGRWNCASLWGRVAFDKGRAVDEESLATRLLSNVENDRIAAALETVQIAYELNDGGRMGDRLKGPLFGMLLRGGAESRAAGWALMWLAGGWLPNLSHRLGTSKHAIRWQPNEHDVSILATVVESASSDEIYFKDFLLQIMGRVACETSFQAAAAMVYDSSERVRLAAMNCLASSGDPRCLDIFRILLSDTSPDVRIASVQGIGKLGQPANEVKLISLLGSAERELRSVVAQVLGQTGNPHVVQPLLVGLKDQDLSVRNSILRALIVIGGDQAVSGIEAELAKADSPGSEPFLASALHHLGISKGTALLQTMTAGSDPEIAQAAVRAYAELADTVTRRLLLSRSTPRYWKPKFESISLDAASKTAELVSLPLEDVKQRYEQIAPILNLQLGW